MTLTEYTQKFFDILDYFKTTVLLNDISPGSDVSTRIISGKGLNDQDWIGYLRNVDTEKVDRWLVAIKGLQGIDPKLKTVGAFDKPIKLSIYYFADYRQGYDFDEDTGNTNTEREFLKKQIALDWYFETLPNGCLPGSVIVGAWNLDTSIMKFPSDSVHHAAWTIDLKLQQIQF